MAGRRVRGRAWLKLTFQGATYVTKCEKTKTLILREGVRGTGRSIDPMYGVEYATGWQHAAERQVVQGWMLRSRKVQSSTISSWLPCYRGPIVSTQPNPESGSTSATWKHD